MKNDKDPNLTEAEINRANWTQRNFSRDNFQEIQTD